MTLTDEQQDQVRAWAAQGASLSDIQTRLADEFGIRMSYMDTRFLVMDINAQLKDKEPPKKAAPPPAQDNVHDIDAQSGGEDDWANDHDFGDESEDEVDNPGGSAASDAGGVAESPAPAGAPVQVEISRIARPGFALTGTVVFSDGVSAEWGITNDGRFSLAAADPAYRPTQDDMRQFQMTLRGLIEKQGY